jgi:hypothetical protein
VVARRAYLIADPFPGYPSGAFVVQGQAHDLGSPRMFLMVGLEDLASALGLEFNGATLPTGDISEAEGADGGGGGGGGGGGPPLGPGVPTHSTGSCSTVPVSAELWPLLLIAAGVLASRRGKR